MSHWYFLIPKLVEIPTIWICNWHILDYTLFTHLPIYLLIIQSYDTIPKYTYSGYRSPWYCVVFKNDIAYYESSLDISWLSTLCRYCIAPISKTCKRKIPNRDSVTFITRAAIVTNCHDLDSRLKWKNALDIAQN